MQKFLTKILLISMIIVGFGNINQANAGELDELNSLFNIEEEFSCSSINSEIENYGTYKYKIDNLFTKLSKKDEETKKKYYTKISKITGKYLKKLNKNRQKKLYTVIGYLKCENENVLEKNISCNENKININEKKYGKVENIYISDDGIKKIIITSKGKYSYCNCPGGEEFVGEYYYFYFKNNILIEGKKSKNRFKAGFINGKYKYLIKYEKNKSYLDYNNKNYSFEGTIYLNKNKFIFSGKKEKNLYFDGSFSKEYDVIFQTKILDNGNKILIIGKGKMAKGMGENFIGDYYLINNGIEKKMDNMEYYNYLIICKNNFGYIYKSNDGGKKFIFGGKNYGENIKTRAFNFYGFKKDTCEPIYVQILDDGKGDFGDSKLFIGKKFIYESNSSLNDPKFNGEDFYFKIFEEVNTNNQGYKLYKNGKKIENRGWVQKYGFLKNNELIYTTVHNGNLIVKKGDVEEEIEGVRWVDKLFISEDKDNYFLKLRGSPNGYQLYLNGEIIKNNYELINGYFINRDFISIYRDNKKNVNYIYKNNKLIKTFKGNPNIVKIKNNNSNKLLFNLNTSILECK